ncbi:hypothetical protein [Streptomyces osmaniensis]|uniref:Uncharacterized protein n=1 Tax=Streptomyces osmaniensis TaxID=593134 RepID=A0ABP6YUZ9_9ACTN|nr:hypothetical protein KJK32_46560 [Streptomyces sp. JCM17656]
MIQPDSDDYYVDTHVFRQGALAWSWTATLRQPYRIRNSVLDEESGSRMTERAAKRKADRVARRMMRAAASWTSRTYEAGKDVAA